MTRIETIFETSDQSPFNHLMPLLGRRSFTEFSRRGNFWSYNHYLFIHSQYETLRLDVIRISNYYIGNCAHVDGFPV